MSENWWESAPVAKRQETSFADDAANVLARTGRAATRGLSEVAGIIADPIQAHVTNPLLEEITGQDQPYVPLSQSALQAYDEATGGEGLPRNALERAVEAGGSALAGGAAFGPATKGALALKTVPELLGTAASGVASQATGEATESPIASAVAGIAAPVAVSGLAAAPSAIKRATAKSLGINPQRVKELQAGGLPVTAPAASDSPMVKTAANQMRELPGGKSLRKATNAAFDAAEEKIRNFGYTGTKTPTDAGKVTLDALNRWKRESLNAFEKADDTLKQLVPDNAKVSAVKDLNTALDDVVKVKGLTASQRRARAQNPAVQLVKKYVADVARAKDKASIASLKELKTELGQRAFPAPLAGTPADGRAIQLYKAVDSKLNKAAGEVAGKAGQVAMRKRNRLYSLYANENKNQIAKLQKKLGDTPEAVWSALTAGDRVGATKASKILSKLDPEEAAVVRDAWMRQKGGGNEFSINKWANSYRKLSPESQKAFFAGDEEAMKAHNKFIDAVANYQDVGAFGNFSRTATTGLNPLVRTATLFSSGAGGAGYISGLTTIPEAAMAAGTLFATGAAFNKTLSEIMASPKLVKSLASSLDKPIMNAGELPRQIVRAFAVNGITEDMLNEQMQQTAPAIQEEAQEDAGNWWESAPVYEQPTAPQTQQQPQNNTPEQQFIQQNEGFRSATYMDTVGKPTIGYGFNLDSGIAPKVWKKSGLARYKRLADVRNGKEKITPEEGEALFQTSYNIARDAARKVYPEFDKLNQSQRLALTDMSYQMGENSLRGFKGLFRALRANDKNAIVSSVRRSKYFEQTPNRAREVMKLLISEA